MLMNDVQTLLWDSINTVEKTRRELFIFINERTFSFDKITSVRKRWIIDKDETRLMSLINLILIHDKFRVTKYDEESNDLL